MKKLSLDDLEGIPVTDTLVWKPVRKTFGVTAFGINAYTAVNAEGPTPPVLLVDEAELHLHYAAQADLIQVLTEQTAASQIIVRDPEDWLPALRLVRSRTIAGT